MLRISTLNQHKRMSTRELLQTISQAVENGETSFQISASGQHDIGGPLWNAEGRQLSFQIDNPGQRVGSMCLPNTKVVVDGPAPADVGWLNSGGEITIKGDAGDTAGHCAAAGKIFIGGRAGTRSGSLMKHDPLYDPPQLWILKNTGSFSFEFMGGGKAIVCGHDCLTLPSVLGDRPCVGMVGGVVYFRGKCPNLTEDAQLAELDDADRAFLDKGLDDFLEAIGKPQLKPELALWKLWHKLEPAAQKHHAERKPMSEFHSKNWRRLFDDVLPDDQTVIPLVPKGGDRLRMPVWNNSENQCLDCRLCLKACPQSAIRRRTEEKAVYAVNEQRCTGCGICAAFCPAKVWQMLKA